MKKYIKPIATIVNISNETILAGSDLNTLSAGDGNDALSRGHRRGSLSDWDDDED